MTSPHDTNQGNHQPFNQFNFNFEILKLIEELLKTASPGMSSLKLKIATNKVFELWDSVEKEMIRQLEADEKAESKRYDI